MGGAAQEWDAVRETLELFPLQRKRRTNSNVKVSLGWTAKRRQLCIHPSSLCRPALYSLVNRGSTLRTPEARQVAWKAGHRGESLEDRWISSPFLSLSGRERERAPTIGDWGHSPWNMVEVDASGWALPSLFFPLWINPLLALFWALGQMVILWAEAAEKCTRAPESSSCPPIYQWRDFSKVICSFLRLKSLPGGGRGSLRYSLFKKYEWDIRSKADNT